MTKFFGHWNSWHMLYYIVLSKTELSHSHRLRVKRDRILEDSFTKIMAYNKKDLQKNKLLISFLGEEGWVMFVRSTQDILVFQAPPRYNICNIDY